MRRPERSLIPIALLLTLSLVLFGCQTAAPAPAAPTQAAPAAQAPAQQQAAPTAAQTAQSSGQTIVVKVSSDTGPDSLKGLTWERFKQIAESKLQGKVEIQVFHAGSLYKQNEQVPALQQGNVHLISPGSAVYTGLVPSQAVYELPYTFKSYQMVIDASKDPAIGGKVNADMEAQGLMSLSTWLNGYRLVGTAKPPITKLEDMQGLKIRTPPGTTYVETFKALGANVVPVNWQEIHTALQQRIVDAIEPTANNWWVEKLHELAPNITYTNHILSTYVVATNKQWWEGLPADIRQGLTEAMEETTQWNIDSTLKENEDAIAKMKEDPNVKFSNLSPEEFDRWRETVQPVIKGFESDIGAGVLSALEQMSSKYEWQKD